jgi:hypothetical protein
VRPFRSPVLDGRRRCSSRFAHEHESDESTNLSAVRAERARKPKGKGKIVAKHEDALIVIQLSRWGTELGVDDAMHEIFADGFDAGDGSSDNESVRKVLNFGETVGSLVKHHVLDWDLISDLYWIDGMWRQVEAHAKYQRQRTGEPRLYEHFEALATRSN